MTRLSSRLLRLRQALGPPLRGRNPKRLGSAPWAACAAADRLVVAGLASLAILAAAFPASDPTIALAADAAERQSNSDKLQALERSAEENLAKAEGLARKAEALQAQILALRSEMIAAARRAQDFEENLSTIERTLSGLEEQEREMSAALVDRRSQLTATLGALQRIAIQPPEAVFAAPGSPIDQVRSALLLRVAVPAIEHQANDLKARLVQLAALREEIGRERSELNLAARDLSDERSFLSGLIARKNELYETARSQSESAKTVAERAAGEARDLRELLARLQEEARRRAQEAAERTERERLAQLARQTETARRALAEAERRAEQAAPAQVARGSEAPQREAGSEEPTVPQTESAEPSVAETAEVDTALRADLTKPVNVRAFPSQPESAPLVMPARGQIATVYGQRDKGGSVSKGLSIVTRKAAQVVAPYDGRVAYAGHFRRYGQILIIEHGGRYHTLLAGVDRIDAVVGQWVLAGEPIGVMTDRSDIAPELYLELRRTGQPINPLPWLARTNDKVQG